MSQSQAAPFTADAPRRAEKRAAACLNEIADLAANLKEEFRWVPTTPDELTGLTDEDAQHLRLFMNRVRDAIDKTGYLAELGGQQLGRSMDVMGTTDWLLAPSYASEFRSDGHEGGAA